MSANLAPNSSQSNHPKAEEISKWRFVLGLRDAEKRESFKQFIEAEIEKRREWMKRQPGFLLKRQMKEWADDMGEKADRIKDRFPKAAEILYIARDKCIGLLTEISDKEKSD